MSATATRSFPDARSLRDHFVGLRRLVRRITWLRGLSIVLALLLPSVLLAGGLDWALNLPGFVRAVFLTGILAGSGVLIYRFLYLPLGERVDDLALALRIEDQYPSLNDSLASTIEFLNQAEQGIPGESPSMRREAVRRALSTVEGCDFERIVDRRWLFGSSLAALLSAGLVVPLFLFTPVLAKTGLERLLNPFGATTWPTKTQIELEIRRLVAGQASLRLEEGERLRKDKVFKIGKGEKIEVRGKLTGVIPEHARVVFRYEGFPPVQHACDVKKENDREGSMSTQLEPERSFSIEVFAGDALAGPFEVKVLTPPVLVPLEGESSPRVELEFPEYTDLPSPLKLTPGNGNVEAVLGTVVHFRAAADRPLKSAFIEYVPELPWTQLAGFLSPLGASHTLGAVVLSSGGLSALERVPAKLSDDRKVLSVTFQPWINGAYALHLEDEIGLRYFRTFELRLKPDPAPTLTLDRPSPVRDLLQVVPTGAVVLKASAVDEQYAVRSMSLRYRTRKGNAAVPAGAQEETQLLPLYDPVAIRKAGLPLALGPATTAWQTLKLRPMRVDLQRMLSMKQIQHPDGSSLAEGDVVILQVIADDYDTVTFDKQPGASHEVEIRIVGRNSLDQALNQEQAMVQQELLKLREKEREAIQKVLEAEKKLKRGEKLNMEEQDRLTEAEQIQQQIHERVGNEDKGLRAQIARIQETLKQNGMQNSAVRDRMADVARELERLADKDLEQVEARLTTARKQIERQAQLEEKARENEKQARLEEEIAEKKKAQAAEARQQAKQAENKQEQARLEEEARRQQQLAEAAQQRAEELKQQAAQDRKEAGQQTPKQQLTDARLHQEEVEKTINDLLARLEPWSSSREVKGEAKQLLQEQKRLQAQLEELKDKIQSKKPEELNEREKADLEALKDQQQRIEERTRQLLEKMERLAEERAQKDPKTAEELRDAQQQAKESNITGQMKEAKEQIAQNQLNKANENQQKSIQGLEKLVKNLEDRREKELERLAKKLKEAQKELEELKDEQEKLAKKIKEAEKKDDKEELKRLAKEQEQLQQKTQELVKQLSRMRSERASQALGKAAGQMEQAGQQMRQGEKPDDPQEALERLNEAKREIERARKQAEEELQREQLIRVAETLQRIKERQEALNAEAARIQNEVQAQKKWPREILLGSLTRLGESEAGLGTETEELAGKELTGTPVFARMLRRAAEAMTEVQTRVKQIKDEKPDPASLPDAQLTRLQQQATRRLTQVLEAIKEQANPNQGGGQPAGGGPGGQGGQEGGGGASQGESGLPPLAQLKLLKALQLEVNQATAEFMKKHPDLEKINEAEKSELKSLRKQQQDIIELVEDLRRPADEPGDGDKEGEKK